MREGAVLYVDLFCLMCSTELDDVYYQCLILFFLVLGESFTFMLFACTNSMKVKSANVL